MVEQLIPNQQVGSSSLSAPAQQNRMATKTKKKKKPKGKSLAETVQAVGRNEDAVKKLQARGLASLRRFSARSSLRLSSPRSRAN